MSNRWTSPVVIGATLAVLASEWAKLANGEVNAWTVGGAVLTVAIAFFAAVNNPTDRGEF